MTHGNGRLSHDRWSRSLCFSRSFCEEEVLKVSSPSLVMFVLAACALTPLQRPSQPGDTGRAEMAAHRPVSCRTRVGGADRSLRFEHLLLREPGGGVWKTTTRDRPGIRSSTRRASRRLARCGRPLEHQGDLCRHRRGDARRRSFRSTDGGATWTNVGLPDTHSSVRLSSPRPIRTTSRRGDRRPDSGPDRGVFRTPNGGRTWTKVLFLDNDSGCPSLAARQTIRAWCMRRCIPQPESRGAGLVAPIAPAPSSARRHQPPAPRPAAVFKSIDGGATWKRLRAQASRSRHRTAGARRCRRFEGTRRLRRPAGRPLSLGRWRRHLDESHRDPRIKPVGVIADPGNARVLYVTQTALYRSVDGGRTFDAFAGAPSGDDYQLLWIHRPAGQQPGRRPLGRGRRAARARHREVAAEDHTAVMQVWARRHRDLSRARNRSRVPAARGALRTRSRRIRQANHGSTSDRGPRRHHRRSARSRRRDSSSPTSWSPTCARVDEQRREAKRRIARIVAASGTSVTDIYGVGPIVAATVLGYVGDISRFPTRDRFAAYNGTAPDRGLLRQPQDPPAVPPRQPATQPRHPHGRRQPDPPPRHRRPRLLRPQDRRRHDTASPRCAR